MITYAYKVNGAAAGGQTWQATGEVSVTRAGNFMHAVDLAIGESFMKLTDGRAVYGKPGIGCVGPYRVTNLWIAEKF